MPSIVHYGWAESTPAMRGILARGAGMLRGNGSRRKKRSKKSAAPKKSKRARVAKGMAHLVKGSPAAKKRMAALRKLAAKARKA
jgi:hypothetical protein